MIKTILIIIFLYQGPTQLPEWENILFRECDEVHSLRTQPGVGMILLEPEQKYVDVINNVRQIYILRKPIFKDIQLYVETPEVAINDRMYILRSILNRLDDYNFKDENWINKYEYISDLKEATRLIGEIRQIEKNNKLKPINKIPQKLQFAPLSEYTKISK